MRCVAAIALVVACGARSDLSPAPFDASTQDASVPDVVDAPVTPVGSFDLTLTPSLVTLVQGGAPASVSIHVTRLLGFAGAVDVTVASLPAGVSATAATIPPDATDATISLTAIAPGPQAAQSATVTGTSLTAASVTKPLSLFVRGCPGCLDTTFSSDGYAFVDHITGHTIAVDASGAVIVPGSNYDWTGSYAKGVVARVLANGDLDTTFGNGGTIEFAPGQGVLVRQISLSSAGDIALCGSTGVSASVLAAKLDATGKLDTSFASGGVLTISGGHCYGLHFLSDATMLMANDVGPPNVVHLLANGSIDAAWGTLVLPWVAGSFFGDANIVVDSSDRALVAGGTQKYAGILITRVASGAVDTTFATSGTLNDTRFTAAPYWVDATPASLLAVGFGTQAANVAKYQANGAHDATFGNDGVVGFTVPKALTTLATAGLLQPNGGVLVMGYVLLSHPFGNRTFTYLRRFTSTGAEDSTFGPGVILFDDGQSDTPGNIPGGMALYPDDRLVVRFNAEEWNAENWVTVLARYWL